MWNRWLVNFDSLNQGCSNCGPRAGCDGVPIEDATPMNFVRENMFQDFQRCSGSNRLGIWKNCVKKDGKRSKNMSDVQIFGFRKTSKHRKTSNRHRFNCIRIHTSLYGSGPPPRAFDIVSDPRIKKVWRPLP